MALRAEVWPGDGVAPDGGAGIISHCYRIRGSILPTSGIWPGDGVATRSRETYPGYLECSPRLKLNERQGGSASFSLNLAMVAFIFISVALKNLKGHPEKVPLWGGVLWKGRAAGINPSPSSNIFEWKYVVIASMLPYRRVMASHSGTDPTFPLFGTVAGELLLTKPGRLWSFE